jgi:predicted TIM-barrel fold metal-dependent hydrolase
MNTLNRRNFAAAVASTSLAFCHHQQAIAAPAGSLRVDTHLHCFAGKNERRFPYHPRAPYTPDEPATPEHLLKCMDAAGVDFAIVVHPEPYQDDHRYLEHCLSVGAKRLKGTALFFSDRAGSVEKLPALAQRADLIAIRVHAYAPDRLPPFGKPELRRLWQMATELGLAVQIHFEPRYAAGFEPLIREFRETRVIIDHLGRPFQGTPPEHAVVMNWSRYPNTIMKLSSIPTNRNYPHRKIIPIIKQLTDRFGPDRMIYGGGFGAAATGASYRAAFDRAESMLDHLSVADRAKILGKTAARLFGFTG